MRTANTREEALKEALAFYEEQAGKEVAQYDAAAAAALERGNEFLTGYYRGMRQAALFYDGVFRRLQGPESGKE